jgi:hypothetical protein
VSNFNFGGSIVFNVDPSTFVSNYYNFLTNIANSVNQLVNTITINNIIYGSATVNFAVSTPYAFGSVEAQNQQKSLQSLLTSQNIAGMTVTTSNLILNGAPSNNNDNGNTSNSNTVLIVGIVVPIASLSIFEII